MGSGRSGARSPAATTRARPGRWRALDPAPADCGRRAHGAGAHAGCGEHTDRRQVHGGSAAAAESVRAGQRAAQAVADADGDRRRGRLALLHHVEVVVEGGDLVDLGLGEAAPRPGPRCAGRRCGPSGPGSGGGTRSGGRAGGRSPSSARIASSASGWTCRPRPVTARALALAWMQGPPRRARLLDDR